MISCEPAHPEGHAALLTLSCFTSVSNVSPEAEPFLVYSLGLRRQRGGGLSHFIPKEAKAVNWSYNFLFIISPINLIPFTPTSKNKIR